MWSWFSPARSTPARFSPPGTLRNPTGPALHADFLRTSGGAFLIEGFTAEGGGAEGAIRLSGAQIGAEFNLSGATLRNPDGPALAAFNLHTGVAVLDDGFTAEGAGDQGAVRLLGAQIDTQLIMCSATLRNPTGPALYAGRLHTGGDVFLNEGFTAEGGGGGEGAVRLDGAQIGGQLSQDSDELIQSLCGQSDLAHDEVGRPRSSRHEKLTKFLVVEGGAVILHKGAAHLVQHSKGTRACWDGHRLYLLHRASRQKVARAARVEEIK